MKVCEYEIIIEGTNVKFMTESTFDLELQQKCSRKLFVREGDLAKVREISREEAVEIFGRDYTFKTLLNKIELIWDLVDLGLTRSKHVPDLFITSIMGYTIEILLEIKQNKLEKHIRTHDNGVLGLSRGTLDRLIQLGIELEYLKHI